MGGFGVSKLTKQDGLEMLRRCAAGESYRRIAVDYGVSQEAVHKRVLDAAAAEGRDVSELVIQSFHARVAQAHQMMMDAGDALEFAKGRESLKYSQWLLERRLSALYGAKQEGAGSGNTYVFQIAPLHDEDFKERVVSEAPALEDGTA
jgi:hypothetical protein